MVSSQRSARLYATVGMNTLLAGALLFALGGCVKEQPARGVASAGSVEPAGAPRPALRTVATVDLGLVGMGGRAEEVIAIENDGAAAQAISRIETSCDCLKVSLSRRDLVPGALTAARVALDFAAEPEFVGELLGGVTAYGPSGQRLFGFKVRALVDDEAALFTARTTSTQANP